MPSLLIATRLIFIVVYYTSSYSIAIVEFSAYFTVSHRTIATMDTMVVLKQQKLLLLAVY